MNHLWHYSKMWPRGQVCVSFERLGLTDEPLLPQIRKLKLQLEEERQKCSRSDGTVGDLAELQNGSDLQLIEMQSEPGPARSPGWAARACGSKDQPSGGPEKLSQSVSHGLKSLLLAGVLPGSALPPG